MLVPLIVRAQDDGAAREALADATHATPAREQRRPIQARLGLAAGSVR